MCQMVFAHARQNVKDVHVKLHAITRTMSGVNATHYIQTMKSSSLPGLANTIKVFQLKNNGFQSYPVPKVIIYSVCLLSQRSYTRGSSRMIIQNNTLFMLHFSCFIYTVHYWELLSTSLSIIVLLHTRSQYVHKSDMHANTRTYLIKCYVQHYLRILALILVLRGSRTPSFD